MADRNSEGVSIELLPLPEPMQVLGDRGRAAAEEWCRANVKERDAEIEALRAEVERQKQWLSFWGNFASRQTTLAGQAEARAERMAGALRKIAALKVREYDDAVGIADETLDREKGIG